MSSLTHPQKVRLARKMRTHAELRHRVSIWDTKAWLNRREARTGFRGGRPTRTVNLAQLIAEARQHPNQKQPFWKRMSNALKGNSPSIKNKASLPQKVI